MVVVPKYRAHTYPETLKTYSEIESREEKEPGLKKKLQRTVTDIVEYIALVDTTTPHPNHVLVPLHDEFQPIAVSLGRYFRKE
jgi:hypothetical protein